MKRIVLYIILFSLILFSEKLFAQQDTIFVMYTPEKFENVLRTSMYNIKYKASRLETKERLFKQALTFESYRQYYIDSLPVTIDSVFKIKKYLEQSDIFKNKVIGNVKKRCIFRNIEASINQKECGFNVGDIQFVHFDISLEYIDDFILSEKYTKYVQSISEYSGFDTMRPFLLPYNNFGGYVGKEEDIKSHYKVVYLDDYFMYSNNTVGDKQLMFRFIDLAEELFKYKVVYLQNDILNDSKIYFEKVAVQRSISDVGG